MNTTFKLELRSEPKLDKTYLILLRITQNRKHKRLSTGVYTFKENFNKKAEFGKWIRRSNPDYQKLNQLLKEKISEVNEIQNELSRNKQSTSANNIITSIKTGNTESFISFFEDRLKKFYDSHSASYYKNVKAKHKKLTEYLKGKDLLFREITVKFLNDYEDYLTKQGLAVNSRIGHLKIIRSILLDGIKEGRFEGVNPFLLKKIKSMKSNKKKLSTDEIRKLQDLNLPKESALWHTKNYFLFAFYCAGIRISDVMQLTWSNIKEGRLQYEMGKTDEDHSIKILPQANDILKKYKTKDSKPSDFIFPILDSQLKKADKHILRNSIESANAKINMNLKKIQELATIETKLSFHISRHSFAEILRQKKVSIYDIKDLLGHSDISQTQNYLKGFDTITADKVHEEALESI